MQPLASLLNEWLDDSLIKTVTSKLQSDQKVLRIYVLGTPALLTSCLSSSNLHILFLIFENILGQFFLSGLHVEGYHIWSKESQTIKWSNSPLTDRSGRCLLALCTMLQIPVCTAVGFVRINHLVLLWVSIQRPQWCVFLITLQGGVNQGIPQLFQVSLFHFIPLCCTSDGLCWWLRG